MVDVRHTPQCRNQTKELTNKSAGIVANTLSGNLVSGGAAFSYTNNASAFVAISAEL